MRKARLYGREITLQGSPYTYLVYRNEFSADILTDIKKAFEGDVDMSLLMQVVWALCATHQDEEQYTEWLRAFDPELFSLADNSALEVIDSAITAELFRVQKAGKVTRWLSQQMGRMAQRFSSASTRLQP